MQKIALTLRRGATADIPIRVESDTLAYASITAIPQRSPLRITAQAHGVPDGWRAALQNVGGMTNLNVDSVRDVDLLRVSKIDANTLEFTGINAAGWRAYTSGGQVVSYAPHDLSVYASARMDVKDSIDGTTLASYSTAGGTLQIDSAAGSVWIHLTAAQTLLLDAGTHLFDIEMVKASGVVVALCSADSTLTVLPEITTS